MAGFLTNGRGEAFVMQSLDRCIALVEETDKAAASSPSRNGGGAIAT